jgi:hypothetical protein
VRTPLVVIQSPVFYYLLPASAIGEPVFIRPNALLKADSMATTKTFYKLREKSTAAGYFQNLRCEMRI